MTAAIKALVERHVGFTEGPWRSWGRREDTVGRTHGYILAPHQKSGTPDKITVALVAFQQVKESEAVANEALIADAPALLSACRELLERVERLEEALSEIKALKPVEIPGTPFTTGPKALLDHAQRIASAALTPDGGQP